MASVFPTRMTARSAPHRHGEPWAPCWRLHHPDHGLGHDLLSVPLIMEPLQSALGASKTAVVGAFTVALLLSGLLAPVVGQLIDRRGGRH